MEAAEPALKWMQDEVAGNRITRPRTNESVDSIKR
jgi:hypothetical protein